MTSGADGANLFIVPAGFPAKMKPPEFIERMSTFFRVYHKDGSPEETQWTASMVSVLSSYDDECLSQTCLHLMRTRKERAFPLPSEITPVCDAVMAERKTPGLLKEMEKQPWAQPDKASAQSHDRRRLALQLIRANGVGLRADSEGWLGELVSFVQINSRMPRPDEIEGREGLKDKADRFRESHEQALRNKTPLGQSLARIGDSMLRNAQIWADVLHGRRDEADLFTDMRNVKDLVETAS